MSRKDLVLALPHVGRLVWRVLRDPRVSWRLRAALLALGAYLVLPFDVIPDWVPVLGELDDLLVLTIGVRTILRRVPESVLLEHWTGDRETLDLLLGRREST